MRLPARDLEETTARMRDRCEGLAGRTILLTGGSGFIGRWLIETLCAFNDTAGAGSQVFVLTRNAANFRATAPHLAGNRAVRILSGDLHALARGTIHEAPLHCDLMIHAATETSAALADGSPDLFAEAIQLTGGALQFSVRTRVRRFLYLSSGAVYGPQPANVPAMPETYNGAPDPVNVRSAYAESKRAGELLCSLYASRFGVETVTARLFAFIGPHLPLDRNFAAGNFLRDVLHGKPVQVRGDGTALRSYLYAGDLAVWLWVLLLHGQSQRAYNVGSEETISIAELAREAASLADPPVPVVFGETASPSKQTDRYIPSTVRARSELNLGETVTWQAALRRTLAWQREVNAMSRAGTSL